MSELIVTYILENDEDVFELSYNSIKDVADKIVIINGNKDEKIYNTNKGNVVEIFSLFPHNKKGAMGIQRNKYIDYVKEHHEGDWVLNIDADEVVENPHKIKECINDLEKEGIEIGHPHMRHFINHLGQEDATEEKHWCLGRLFKVTKDIYYPETEHCLLQGVKGRTDICVQGFTLWHMGYAREMFRINKKTLNHRAKSEIHTPEYLDTWQHNHMMGTYPTKPVPYHEIPKIIREYFHLNDDFIYFKDRGVELKHAEMVRQWNEYFKPESITDIGCGRGPYLRYWEMCVEYCLGLEISKWAIDNKICNSTIEHGDITKDLVKADLVTAIDILEHLEETYLQKALKNIYDSGNKFLFSIPFEGDPNLYGDHTHKIFKPKVWWISELEKAGFKIKETPDNWYYNEQIVVAEK